MSNPLIYEVNKEYDIKIHDIGNQGEGIGKIDGFTFFVEGVIPQDFVRMKITKLKKSHGFGKVTKILEPSPFRTVPPCKYFSRCGGCNLQHLKYDAQLAYKQKRVVDSLERIGGFAQVNVNPIIGMDKPFNYRNKAQFPVQKSGDKISVGHYSEKTHDVVSVDNCLIHNKAINKFNKILEEYMSRHFVSAYNEKTRSGLIRHLVVRTGHHTGEILVCLVATETKIPDIKHFVDAVKSVDGVKGIFLNVNSEPSSVVFGNKTEKLWGEDGITDFLYDSYEPDSHEKPLKVFISPLSFYQVNTLQSTVLYDSALKMSGVGKDDIVLDLYCGIGTISLLFAKYAKKVVGVEIVEDAIDDARKNAKINGIENVEFIFGDASNEAAKIDFNPDIVVVDPPRKGCEQNVLDSVIKLEPKKIIYVSCDPATMSRDLKILCENKYHIEEVQPVDMFPMTMHVETVALLSKLN